MSDWSDLKCHAILIAAPTPCNLQHFDLISGCGVTPRPHKHPQQQTTCSPDAQPHSQTSNSPQPNLWALIPTIAPTQCNSNHLNTVSGWTVAPITIQHIVPQHPTKYLQSSRTFWGSSQLWPVFRPIAIIFPLDITSLWPQRSHHGYPRISPPYIAFAIARVRFQACFPPYMPPTHPF